MGKVAFVFSGQGDQFPGMGQKLPRTVFDLCDRIRPGTSRQCFEGTPEELKRTDNTQPCLYAVEQAGVHALENVGIHPDAVAGFSLGEIAAAACAGLYDLETGFRLVTERGRLMQAAADAKLTAMAAVLKLTNAQVEALCAAHPGLYPVNYNCPGQVTVSGLADRLPDFLAEVKAAGGRAIPLKVAGAFHSPYMEEAAAKFGRLLDTVSFAKPRIPLYSDLTAQVYGDDPRMLLSKQICSPVQWEALVRNMIADDVDTFIEVGPGRTLTNLIRKINPGVIAMTLNEKLEEAHVNG